jgi:Domain of unknown function (DUF4189)
LCREEQLCLRIFNKSLLAAALETSMNLANKHRIAVVLLAGQAFWTVSLVCLALCLGAANASADDHYGAIAYSPSTGAQGWSYDYDVRVAAESAAMTICRQGAIDCIVPVWFRNACGALAVGTRGYGSGWGTSRDGAENEALGSCRKHSEVCAIRRWACTTR